MRTNLTNKIIALVKQDTNDKTIKWLTEKCEQNTRLNGTDKWNDDMEELVDILSKENK